MLGTKNQEYISKELEYYDELFSDNFVNYIDKEKLFKEELLKIRNKVLESSSIFDRKHFIVDSTSFANELISLDNPNRESFTPVGIDCSKP